MEPCLIGMVDYEENIIKCALCREIEYLPDRGLQEFPHNFVLQELLDYHLEQNKPIQGMN